MRLSLADLHATIRQSGLPELQGLPTSAIMAAIAAAEGGDPEAWVEHDPPRSSRAPPSSGLYQVNRGSWPEIYEATEQVRLDTTLSDRQKVVRMTDLARPILADALETAAAAQRTLAARGMPPAPLQVALFVNATWQAGSDNVLEWARRTVTGNPGEIVNPKRALAVAASLRHLAADALGLIPGAGMILGVFALFGLAAFAVSQLET